MKLTLKKISASLKAFGYRKIIIITLALVLFIYIIASFFRAGFYNDYYDGKDLISDYSFAEENAITNVKTYSAYLEDHRSDTVTNDKETILTSDMTGNSVDQNHGLYGNIVNDYKASHTGSDVIYLLDANSNISFTNQSTASGLFYFGIDYYEISESIDTTQINISVNDKNPYNEALTLGLPSNWEFIKDDFSVDRYGNEIQPSSERVKKWYNHNINDNKGSHAGLLAFYLEPGDVITIKHVNNDVLIGQFYYVENEKINTYENYLDSHKDAKVVDASVSIAARDMDYRTDPSIRLRSESDPSNMYYHTQYLYLNVIYGSSWENSGGKITYKVDTEEAGLYNLSFKYRQYMIKDMNVFRKIYINGEVPYDELEAYAFPYSTDFVNRTLVDENNEKLYVYLEKGENTITLESVNYPYRYLIEVIKTVMSEIQKLALEVKKYTSGGTDLYRDWDIDEYFPNAKSDMEKWATLLEETHKKMLSLSVNSNPSEMSNLLVSADRLKNLASEINKLPSRMVQFSDGDSSISQLLGGMMMQFMRSNIELEKIVVHGNDNVPSAYANVFHSFFESFLRLILSFTNNQYAATGSTDTELVIWVNHPRQYIEIMQTLIDEKYHGEYKITLSQMPDQNKLILANASGESPDIAIGVDHWIPYDFSIRDAALDLRQFNGYEELVKNFSKGAMIPYVFEDGVYGIPETQNFWVTYYREDILNSIGIYDVPQTWDEIIEILPLLQSYGMNYYLPISVYKGLKPFVATLPFIYQFGGKLYTNDGMQTAINSEETLEGITLMADLFTKYNVQKYVASFYNKFRYGTLPIGIADLSVYLLLQTAAPELDGLWKMDLHPGVENEKGEILRYAASGAQSSMIMSSTNKPEEAWNFLKWWMSSDIQTEFGNILQTTYGNAYFWNTANLTAFSKLSMPSEYKKVVLKQWEYAIEASRIPGSYMVEREISNAWTKIVYNGVNPRRTLDEAVRISNREILYKMEEFDYVVNGVPIKNYVVPDIYNIDYWLTERN